MLDPKKSNFSIVNSTSRRAGDLCKNGLFPSVLLAPSFVPSFDDFPCPLGFLGTSSKARFELCSEVHGF